MFSGRRLLLFAKLCVSSFLLAGCFSSVPPATLYDFGPILPGEAEQVIPPGFPALDVSRVGAPAWLQNTLIYYRQAHVNEQQTRFYIQSRWNMTPSELIRENIRARIYAAGGALGGGRIVHADELRLVVNIKEFSHYFLNDSASEGRVTFTVSVLRKGEVIAQNIFYAAVPAATPDAQGGVKALSEAVNTATAEMLVWIVQSQNQGGPR